MNMLDLFHAVASLLTIAASVLAAAACGYLLLLTVCSRALRSRTPAGGQLRFAIVVPAHDEAAGIARTVRNLHALDWPRDQFEVMVVADNCSDDTAAQAAAAGATVLERHDAQRRGKGYALALAFGRIAERGWADAVAVIDADSRADGNLLAAMATRIAEGAQAIQAHYAVLNPGDSWRTRLMTIAMSAFHTVRSRGREHLDWSCGIRGNGWCVTQRLLREVPYSAYSVVEDVEYGARLALAGHRVEYLEEACVRAEMVTRAEHAAPQRRRWELGRKTLVRTLVPELLATGFRCDDTICLDLAADLLVPPLSQLALTVVAGLIAAAALHLPWMVWLNLASGLALIAYVGRGWQLSGLGWNCIFDLLRVPYFVFWKLAVLARNTSSGWTRTQRERP
jgi:cellulose synthase/poly-beta-1,6-N-acetylglucosamine synthase-like glycosyltransferase